MDKKLINKTRFDNEWHDNSFKYKNSKSKDNKWCQYIPCHDTEGTNTTPLFSHVYTNCDNVSFHHADIAFQSHIPSLSLTSVILCAHDKMSTKQMHFILIQFIKGKTLQCWTHDFRWFWTWAKGHNIWHFAQIKIYKEIKI